MVITQKAIAHEMVDVKNKQLSSISQQLAPMAEIIHIMDLKEIVNAI